MTAQTPEICLVVLNGGIVWLEPFRRPMAFFGFFVFSQPIVTDAELHEGNKVMAVGKTKSAAGVFIPPSGRLIPVNGGEKIPLGAKGSSQRAADFGPRRVVAHTAA